MSKEFRPEIYPFCSRPRSLDFSNDQCPRDILYYDKHTRIEGLCSEAAFMEDVADGNLKTIVSDFWFSASDDGYILYKLLPDPDIPLTPLDYKILDGMTLPGRAARVYVVWFDEDPKAFHQCLHAENQRYTGNFRQYEQMKVHCGSPLPELKYRNQTRIGKAVDYLEARNQLKAAAIRRIFANCYLSKATWDIDAFTPSLGDKVVALEVKHKFPAKDEIYGINKEQAALLFFLIKIGMAVVHVILEKPKKSKSMSAVDLLTGKEYPGITRWLFKRIGLKDFPAEVRSAPEETSFDGRRKMKYLPIPAEQFSELKRFRVPGNNIRERLLEGIP